MLLVGAFPALQFPHPEGGSGGPPTTVFADLSRGDSLGFSQDNNFSAASGFTVLQQPTVTGWQTMFWERGALFAIARRSPAATYRNTAAFLTYMEGGSDQTYIGMNGGAFGVVGDRNRLTGRTAGAGNVVKSAQVDEDAFLAVLFTNPDNRTQLDWYSLADGTRHAGAAGGQIFTSQDVPAQGFLIGGRRTVQGGQNDGWPGEIAAIGYVHDDIPEAVWQSIALGADIPTALSAYTLRWLRRFDGTAESLLSTDGTQDTVVLAGSMAPGSSLARQTQASYLTVEEWEDGYVHGLIPGETSRDVTFAGSSAGRSGTVEVRIAYEATGEVLVDWTSLGAVGPTWSGSVTVPQCSKGWVVAQFRTSDAPDTLTEARRRFGVGYKFLQLGQSQTQIYLDTMTRGDLPAINDTMSYATSDVAGSNPAVQQMTLIGAQTSDGISAFVDQFRAFDSATPVMIIDAAINGTGPDQLMDDANAGRDWAILQAKLDRWGNDVSAVVMNWATQGWDTSGTVEETLEALIYGTGTYGGTIDHHLTAALRAGFAFGLSPATRHSRAAHEAVRAPQVSYANASGLTVGLPVADFEIEPAGGPHQNGAELGNRVFGARMAHLGAKAMGLSVPDNPYFTGATRAGGVITVTVALPNGGALSSPAPSALSSFQVDEGGGWTGTGFSAVISGDTVLLTRDSGTWAAGTQVRYLANGPSRADGDSAAEAAIIDGMLYETYAADVLGLGLPVSGGLSGGQWVPGWETVTP